jgi:hypothetical protein
VTVCLSSASLSHNSSFRNKIGPNLTFLCVCYGSLYLLSSLSLVRLCGVLFLVTTSIITLCRSKSLRLQCYKTHIFQNAFIFSSELATGISQGLNVTYLSNVVLSKISLISQDKYSLNGPVGIGLIFSGRIKGRAGTRSVHAMSALCVGSFSSRILDLGYKTSVSSLGLVGVKVGIVI